MAHGLDDVAGAGLAFCPDHGRALVDASQRLAEIPAAANERHLESMLVDVVHLVGRREHLGFVDVVDAECLEHLGLNEMPDPGLGHDRDADRRHDPQDHLGVAHASHAAGRPNVGRDALECHHCTSARVFGDSGVLRSYDVHDDAAFEHLGKAFLGGPGGGLGGHSVPVPYCGEAAGAFPEGRDGPRRASGL